MSSGYWKVITWRTCEFGLKLAVQRMHALLSCTWCAGTVGSGDVEEAADEEEKVDAEEEAEKEVEEAEVMSTSRNSQPPLDRYPNSPRAHLPT